VTLAGRLLKIPDDITDEQAVLIEPCGSGMRAALRRPAKPATVLVIGCGTRTDDRGSIRAVQLTVNRRCEFSGRKNGLQDGRQHVIMLRPDTSKKWRSPAQMLSGMFGNRIVVEVRPAIRRRGQAGDHSRRLALTRAGGCVVIVGCTWRPRIDLTPVCTTNDLLASSPTGRGVAGQRILTFERSSRLRGKLNSTGSITHRFLLRYREALLTALEQPRTHAIKVVFEYAR
jgi:hypothetical protein